MINLDNIFNLFSREKLVDENIKNYPIAYHSTTYKLLMYKKIIVNGEMFTKEIIKIFKSSPDLKNIDEINEFGEHLMNVRAYFWLEQIKEEDIQNITWNLVEKPSLLTCLSQSSQHFEGREEFEKCAHIKKFQDFIKNP